MTWKGNIDDIIPPRPRKPSDCENCEHLRGVAMQRMDTIRELTAECDRLRAECQRLRKQLPDEWIESDYVEEGGEG